jgi:outer membrane murein-binding lipoprotein Lpp
MLNSHAHRKLWLAVAASGFLTLAGCSNQPPKPNQAADAGKTTAPAKQVEPTKKVEAAKQAEPPKQVAPAKKLEPAKKVAPAKQAKQAEPVKPLTSAKKATPAAVLVTVPKGTSISATVSQTLASNKNHAGDSFAASLSTPVKVGGKIVIPKGAHVTGRVVAAKKKGPAELTVALASVEIQGKSYALKTDSVAPSGKNDITVPAASHLKFKLAKSVNVPVRG